MVIVFGAPANLQQAHCPIYAIWFIDGFVKLCSIENFHSFATRFMYFLVILGFENILTTDLMYFCFISPEQLS